MLAKQHHSSPFPSPSCVRPNGSSAALGGRNRSSKHPWSIFPPPFRARRFADGGRRRRGQYDAVCFSLCYSPVPSPYQAIHLLEKTEIQKVNQHIQVPHLFELEEVLVSTQYPTKKEENAPKPKPQNKREQNR
nr:uncharacterized protein LOC109169597 [Ipomoea batatas]